MDDSDSADFTYKYFNLNCQIRVREAEKQMYSLCHSFYINCVATA